MPKAGGGKSSGTFDRNKKMVFPKKFKPRLELKAKDLVLPNKTWITYSVCGSYKNSCGWEGWILESVRKKTGKRKNELSIDARQLCPECGKKLFRTEVSLQFTLDRNQAPDLIPGVDYQVVKMKYE